MRNCLILGSGRSGTSLAAGSLSKAGYFMGDELLPPGAGNPKGFFEDYEINGINEDLLDPVVPKRPMILGKARFCHRPLRGQRWLARLPLGKDIPCPAEIARRIQRATLREPYCFKDPRFCYTLPVWRPYLKNLGFVCVFRDPAITAASILRECEHAPITMTLTHALKAWTQMYRQILGIHRHEGDWLFLHYDQMLSQDGLNRLGTFLDAPVDHNFPDVSLSRSTSAEKLPRGVCQVYEELCELAGYRSKLEGRPTTWVQVPRHLRRWQIFLKERSMAVKDHSRYARDWNTYSLRWDLDYSSRYGHLGDEWNDDRTVERKRDSFYFTAYAERWIRPEMTVLEVGPGGGKWTVRIAPKVKHLIVLDVAEEMLSRTRARCKSLGINNVEYVLANGQNFQPVADESVDFFFSYDVFVHIALEDSWPYAQEAVRVLKPGGLGVCHFAINSVPEAWERIEQNNDWYRGGIHTLGQFYYFSPETLRRMYEKCGLRIVEQHEEGWHCTCIFEKPSLSMVPRLESLLKRLTSPEADDPSIRAEIISTLQALPIQLGQSLGSVLVQAQAENDFNKRFEFAAAIRHVWRGL